MTSHPLDRPVWSSLTTRHACWAQGDSLALRIHREVGLFVAARDPTPAAADAVAALVSAGETVGMLEAPGWPIPAGLRATVVPLVQMVATAPSADEPAFAYRRLTDADGTAMLALARLTEPGPFFAQTHRLGPFYGVEAGGELVAMAGVRLGLPHFTEISGVCTHPDHRGHGLAAGLMRRVARDIVAQGDAAFLHVRAHNRGAIALYERLGFRRRAEVDYVVMTRDLLASDQASIDITTPVVTGAVTTAPGA